MHTSMQLYFPHMRTEAPELLELLIMVLRSRTQIFTTGVSAPFENFNKQHLVE